MNAKPELHEVPTPQDRVEAALSLAADAAGVRLSDTAWCVLCGTFSHEYTRLSKPPRPTPAPFRGCTGFDVGAIDGLAPLVGGFEAAENELD